MNFNQRHDKYRPTLGDMMHRKDSTWDGHLGWNPLSKRHVELVDENTMSIHVTPYRAGARQLQLKRGKVEKLVKHGVADSAT